MNPFEQHGACSWFELLTSDVAAAQEFYGQLLGWTLKDSPVGDMPYTLIEVAGEAIGGMASVPANQPNMPPTWGLYITVEDVNAIADKAPTLGGKVLMPPMKIESVGQFALIQDPQGATFCVIEYSQSA